MTSRPHMLLDGRPSQRHPGSLSDLDELLVRIGEGDVDAFAQLYEQVVPSVYGLTKRLLRNRAYAEEVTQEVFLQVWLHAASYGSAHGSARTWVMKIAHHRAVDRVRAEQRRSDRERRAAFTTYDRPIDSTFDQLDITLDYEQVRRGLMALTSLQREAIMLAYFTASTYADVARRLDVPVPTVKDRINRGMRALCAYLTHTDDDRPRV